MKLRGIDEKKVEMTAASSIGSDTVRMHVYQPVPRNDQESNNGSVPHATCIAGDASKWVDDLFQCHRNIWPSCLCAFFCFDGICLVAHGENRDCFCDCFVHVSVRQDMQLQ